MDSNSLMRLSGESADLMVYWRGRSCGRFREISTDVSSFPSRPPNCSGDAQNVISGGGRFLRISPAVGIALLIVTFSAGSAAQNAASSGVVPAGIYANHEKVAAALAKGGPLIDNPNTPAAIKVSGSYRDKAGVVEVHEKETDVFYVSDGEATLIAGGTRVKAKNAAADNRYDVEGGKTFHLTKGDIMIIPAGSPHWFKDVPKSISYHLVKLTTPPGGTGTDVTYVDHDKVAAALNSKGEIFSAPKLRLSGGYRTGPDQPANYGADLEVHPTSIDIFYCIEIGRAHV
jgi:mannose-6-phosphate isomerase-like protein (cupin superfamily)